MSDWGNSDSWSLELLEVPRLFLYLSVSLHMVYPAQQLWEAGHFMTWFRALKAHVPGERERARKKPETAIYSPDSEITQGHFHPTPFVKTITKTTPLPSSRGEDTDSNSW